MNRRLTEPIPAREAAASTPVRAVVALGSNLGDREAMLTAAVHALAHLPLVDAVVASEPIESVAMTPEGPDDTRPAYLNAVALVTTRQAPSVLLGHLQRIEKDHGRVRGDRVWADRTLDLDLIAYGDVRSDDTALTLPHPRAHERDFVLAPWLVVDPDAELPGYGRVDRLLADLRSSR
ncbi:MAG: 2-amino-4-hydroxy-6-hydroxymethyldihydropteridine diphosphokinase [Microbacterium sp.]|uniref:2-amino-4-hydroxy-6- hydroxymethyldihydropteridine diphosphokinase n=1 Tax=Microbacterium sp. TaxID=51671 RepID=UPI003A83F393